MEDTHIAPNFVDFDPVHHITITHLVRKKLSGKNSGYPSRLLMSRLHMSYYNLQVLRNYMYIAFVHATSDFGWLYMIVCNLTLVSWLVTWLYMILFVSCAISNFVTGASFCCGCHFVPDMITLHGIGTVSMSIAYNFNAVLWHTFAV